MRALWDMLREDPWIARVLAAFACLQLLGAAWDLPSTFGWENDGIAPRDVFGGVAFNLTPGQAHRYPLFHYAVLAIASLPALLFGVLGADSLDYAALERAMLSVPVMTGISVAAKLLAIGMACIAVAALARVARRTLSPEAARWTVLVAITSLTFTYYARTSNLDVPYLMWTVLALDRFVLVLERGERRDYLWLAAFAAASVATKDQAYASYVLPGLVYLVASPLVRRGALPAGRAHWTRLAQAVGVGALVLGALGGGLLNPTGFVARVHMLTGTNSQDWRTYSRDLEGLLANANDLVAMQGEVFWPWPLAALAWLGVMFACRPHPLRAQRLLAIAFGLSSTLLFTLVVGRASHRFLLPLGFMLAYYAGFACARGAEALRRAGRGALVPVLGALVLLPAAARSGLLVLTQWGDARRQVEAFLSELPEGTTVETYGLLVYQPRFDGSERAPYRVTHVGTRDLKLPGVQQRVAPYPEVGRRKPDLLVIPEGYAARYLPEPAQPGRVRSNQDARSQADAGATAFMRAAVADQLDGYRMVLRAEARLPGWAHALGGEPIRIHGSTAGDVRLLARLDSPVARSLPMGDVARAD